jgi:hypothetical protein
MTHSVAGVSRLGGLRTRRWHTLVARPCQSRWAGQSTKPLRAPECATANSRARCTLRRESRFRFTADLRAALLTGRLARPRWRTASLSCQCRPLQVALSCHWHWRSGRGCCWPRVGTWHPSAVLPVWCSHGTLAGTGAAAAAPGLLPAATGTGSRMKGPRVLQARLAH